ncbi:MAG: hypothetical protein P4L42_10215 [Desulfocapsaceae bacterium]|nr:hypothetical protein [Desulfocapsaceae bacterium]
MKQCAVVLVLFVLCGCSLSGPALQSDAEKSQEYSSTAITLSDFSMKIVAHYQMQNNPVPADFDTRQFFALLEKIYPDQAKVAAIRENYRVSVRSLDSGYSVMLCDVQTNQKIMEDLSCHVNRVEIRSWENAASGQCAFEDNWRPYCK